MDPVLQPTAYIGETVEGMVNLGPEQSRTLVHWLLDRVGGALLTDVFVIQWEGGVFALWPDGSMRPIGDPLPEHGDVGARIVAAAGAERPEEPAAANGRLSDVDHQGYGLPEGTSGAPVDGPWRPYKVSDDEYVPHHADRDVFDQIESTPTFEECWPRCWYLNAVAPDGAATVDVATHAEHLGA